MIILIFLLILLIVFYNKPDEKNLRYIYNENVEGTIDMMPLNVSYALSDYKGNVDQRSIYKALYMLVKDIIPDYYNKLSSIQSEGIEKYFSKNKNNIKKELGITEVSDFKSFIETIKNLQGNTLVLKEYTFHPDAVKKTSEYLENILLIKYENNEKIGIYVKIYNEKDEKGFAIECSGGVSDSYLDYEYGSEREKKEYVPFTSPGKVINK